MRHTSTGNNGDEEAPLLSGDSSDSDDSKETRSGLPKLLDFFWGGIYAPDATTYDPIETLLNTEDRAERDRLTEKWRDNRLNELSFVGVVVSPFAS